ncbi:MAG: glycosyltransferase family 2 protein [Rivularia sp. (in: Bacteria)]|nr:glycosyltransferase family 2 protein [Rivularia sp. MS3]
MLTKKSYKIAAYITAYQDIEALEKTIEAIKQQSYKICKIFIVDNSLEPIISATKYQDIIVEHHSENIGVDGGLNISIKWAIEQGYDFLWLFDQDSEPLTDSLEILLGKYQALSAKNQNIGIIAPKIFDINTSQEFPGHIFQNYKFVPKPGYLEAEDYYDCDGVITSGSLVNLNAAKSVGIPQNNFFLDAVDYAYCMKFRQLNYEIIVVKNTELKHRLGNYSKVKDRHSKTQNEIVTFTCSPSRYYYACRNHTYFETRQSNKRMLYLCLIHRFKFMINMINRITRYEPDLVFLKVWACTFGTFDGLRGRLGKTW